MYELEGLSRNRMYRAIARGPQFKPVSRQPQSVPRFVWPGPAAKHIRCPRPGRLLYAPRRGGTMLLGPPSAQLGDLAFSLKPPKWLRKAQPLKIVAKIAPIAAGVVAGAFLAPIAAPIIGKVLGGGAGILKGAFKLGGKVAGGIFGKSQRQQPPPFVGPLPQPEQIPAPLPPEWLPAPQTAPVLLPSPMPIPDHGYQIPQPTQPAFVGPMPAEFYQQPTAAGAGAGTGTTMNPMLLAAIGVGAALLLSGAARRR